MKIREIALGIALITSCFGLAFAQGADIDPMLECEGAAAAFKAYAVGNTDPDMEAATAMVKEGETRCKNDRHDEGLELINHATGMIHDHKKT